MRFFLVVMISSLLVALSLSYVITGEPKLLVYLGAGVGWLAAWVVSKMSDD